MIQALFNIPSNVPRSSRRYFSIANVAGLGGLMGHTALLLSFLYFDITPMVWFNIGSVLIFAVVIFLNRYKASQKGFSTLCIYLSIIEIVAHAIIAITLLGWDSGFYAYLFLVFIVVFLVQKEYDKLGLVVSICNLLIMAGLSIYSQASPNPPIELSNSAKYFFSTFNLICTAGLLAAGVYYYKITSNFVEKELETMYGKVTDSIRYAHRIQRVMLPQPQEITDHTKESFVYYKPRDIVSGDFYWAKYFPEQDQLVIALLDCTGHGVPGAFMTMMASTLLESIIINRGIRLPNLILEELHGGIVSLLKQESSNRQEGMDIGICTIDFKDKEICYSGARRPLLVLRKGVLEEVKATRRSVGGQWTSKRQQPEFDLHCFPIDSQPTSIYLFSDGYTDQFGGPTHQKFTSRRFKEMIVDIQHLSMADQKTFILETFNNWSKADKQIDDVAVLGIKI